MPKYSQKGNAPARAFAVFVAVIAAVAAFALTLAIRTNAPAMPANTTATAPVQQANAELIEDDANPQSAAPLAAQEIVGIDRNAWLIAIVVIGIESIAIFIVVATRHDE